MAKNKNTVSFIRWGSLVPQYHSLERNTYHTPPVEYGFYAFPRGYVTKFMIPGSSDFQNGSIRKVHDDSGKPIVGVYDDFRHEGEWHPKWIKFFKTHNLKESQVYVMNVSHFKESEDLEETDDDDNSAAPCYLIAENPPRVFEYKGLIWSHLEFFEIWRSGDVEWVEITKRKRVIDSNDIIKRSGSWVLTDFKTYKRALKKYASMARFEYLRIEKHSNKEALDPFSGGRYEFKYLFEVYIESIQSKKKAA